MVNKPLFINADSSIRVLKPEEAPFLKDCEISVNANGNADTGTANPSGEGQNELVLTPKKSIVEVPGFLLPSGYNKNIGSFESTQTNEVYCLTFNSEGEHCVHVISGDDGSVYKIAQDPNLGFSDNQEHFIADNRVMLRVIRNASNEIVEKILILTDYYGWQKWINTMAAIQTDGFNPVIYPYWAVKQPHLTL